MKLLRLILFGSIVLFLCFPVHALDKQSIVAYWPCDEGKGDKVKDIIGGVEGTLMVGPGWTGVPHKEGWGEGRFGKGLAFDEKKEWFVDVGTNDELDKLGKKGTAFTVTYWVKSGKVGGKGRTVEKGSSGWTQGWHCALVNGRAFSEGCDNVPPGWQLSGGKIIADSQWHHIVHIFEVGKKASIYIDGAPDGQFDISSDPDIAGIGWPITFGSVGKVVNAWHEFLDGTMDDIALFNKALSEAEIREVMAGPVAQAVEAANKLITSWGEIKGMH